MDLPEDVSLRLLGEGHSPLSLTAVALSVVGSHLDS